jgi:hypothetical protein
VISIESRGLMTAKDPATGNQDGAFGNAALFSTLTGGERRGVRNRQPHGMVFVQVRPGESRRFKDRGQPRDGGLV